MSKSKATESHDNHETPETSRKRGRDDEGNKDIDEIMVSSSTVNSTTLTTQTTAPAAAAATVDDFLATADLNRLLITFVPDDMLLSLRMATKAWKLVAEELLMMVLRAES